MVFEHGAKCWNGPERSTRVELECGADNEIIKVTEPAKCEYVIKMRSPIVCMEPGKKVTERDEL